MFFHIRKIINCTTKLINFSFLYKILVFYETSCRYSRRLNSGWISINRGWTRSVKLSFRTITRACGWTICTASRRAIFVKSTCPVSYNRSPTWTVSAKRTNNIWKSSTPIAPCRVDRAVNGRELLFCWGTKYYWLYWTRNRWKWCWWCVLLEWRNRWWQYRRRWRFQNLFWRFPLFLCLWQKHHRPA